MNPCDECDYRATCGYVDEEDQCPKRRRELALSYTPHGDERDDEALDAVREVLCSRTGGAGQLALL